MKRAKTDNGTFCAINEAETKQRKDSMATEEKINSEEQLQEENITTQTEETQQDAEQQDAAKNSAEDAAETPEVEIDPLEAAQAAEAATLNYGSFITAVINFLLMAFVIFCFIKFIVRVFL